MGKRPQPRLRIDALTGEWRNREAGEGRGYEPCEPGALRHHSPLDNHTKMTFNECIPMQV